MNFLLKVFLLSSFISVSAHAFTLNNSAKLVFAQDEVKVNVANIACTNIGIDLVELKSIVADAVDLFWNTSPTSRLKLRAGSIVNVAAAYGTDLICNAATNCVPNPALAVASDILITCNTHSIPGNFSSLGVLAVTVPNNISGTNIVGALIMINDLAGNQFAEKSRPDKVSIIAHELGHAFGLAHSKVDDSLMYYRTVNLRARIGSDDIDGITYLYPKQQPVTCGTVADKNNPNSWLGLLLGFGLITLFSKFQFRYLKLRPRL